MAKTKTKRAPTRGPRGERGFQGPPGVSPSTLADLIRTVEELHADAGIQFKRIAQLQAQLDLTLKTLHDMGEKAGRQRKKVR